MFKPTTDHQALNRNLDSLAAALDQKPTGLLRALLRLYKRWLERQVPAYEINAPAYDTVLTARLREIGIEAELTGYCLECGTYHDGAKAVQAWQ